MCRVNQAGIAHLNEKYEQLRQDVLATVADGQQAVGKAAGKAIHGGVDKVTVAAQQALKSTVDKVQQSGTAALSGVANQLQSAVN